MWWWQLMGGLHALTGLDLLLGFLLFLTVPWAVRVTRAYRGK